MIRSMTAFANRETVVNGMIFSCEIRAVNHRYCDVTMKLPEWLRFTEGEIRAVITDRLKRGKIECSVSSKNQAGQLPELRINDSLVRSIIATTGEIEAQMKKPAPISAMDILAFPGVQQETEINKEAFVPGIRQLLTDAVAVLLEARAREGRQLAVLIEDRCGQIQQQVDTARQRMPEVMQNLRKKLTGRVHEISENPDQDRLEQELVFLTQKMGVEEELDRLDTHVQEVSRLLKLEEPVGRKLDFIMQEMNREANTLGSKSADVDITAISIELKVLIEQIREQIQNIE